ncbi:hypothetical protein [Methanoplanus limicola]|uniref:Uncharacterized protein n=1 Tax=Methanoplanus limicola DSM 2279 TaxID=937775 RepID=H1Z3N4_9EURY|nr:hypothetical protein [Methanoplanus limicola]EHQ35633.1 hypothetical protein Metlim_1532 [Methanoplanus limicola DSM 2279]
MTLKENARVTPITPAAKNNYASSNVMPCNSIKQSAARVIDPELIQKLDPLEALICQKFVNEGRWIIRAE